jgi:general secretion pathway protein A
MNESQIQKGTTGEDTVSVRATRAAQVESTERPLGAVQRRGLDQQLLDYYGLNEQPFGVTPDPRFLYFGSKHRQALDALNYSTELNRGFVTLIAKPGMGKTSLLFHYLEALGDRVRTAYLFQTDCDTTEMMRYVLAELDLTGKGMDLPEMRALLSQILLDKIGAGQRFVLVIDEGQNLDEKVLESVRLLSNFETPSMKLMHIVLAGQPQLADKLAKPSMTQLRQRVSFSIRLEPFCRGEVDQYVNHRLRVAGYNGPPLFSAGARTMIAERSGGIPRVINNMCFCAMSYAWALKQKTIDREIMSEVLDDLDAEPRIEKEKEKEVPAAITPPATISPLETKPVVSKSAEPLGFALSPIPSRGKMPRIAVVFSAIFVLAWIMMQPSVQRWMESSYNEVSNSPRRFLAPTNDQTAPDPRSAVGPAGPMTTPKADGSSEVPIRRSPSQKERRTTVKDGGRN